MAPPTGAAFAADTLLLAGIAGAARAENRDADRPSAARVRARDRTCRFPGCTVPAARCQLDHIVWRSTNPEAGGWTIESNLQCACAFNHELETVGLWHAVALPGMAILWTGPRSDRHLTLPAGGLTPVPSATAPADDSPQDRDDPPF